jgi:hypothetical protein
MSNKRSARFKFIEAAICIKVILEIYSLVRNFSFLVLFLHLLKERLPRGLLKIAC